jgi:hypothetical protein
MSSIISDICLAMFLFFCIYDNFERIVCRLELFLISDDFFSIIWLFYWFSSDWMRVNHALFALMTIYSIQIQQWVRLLAMFYQIDRVIKALNIATFNDRLFIWDILDTSDQWICFFIEFFEQIRDNTIEINQKLSSFALSFGQLFDDHEVF